MLYLKEKIQHLDKKYKTEFSCHREMAIIKDINEAWLTAHLLQPIYWDGGQNSYYH